ncbi:MAG TPA: transposase [Thermoguttaceae bacterium]|nr:transposase [Thermoguttaceae bacterium]
MCYHVINRGNGRVEVFRKGPDYAAFLKLLGDASERVPMRLLAYCLLPNHFHLVVWPHGDGDLGRWMQWLLTSHVRRYHRHYESSGHVWQGRFKAFPIEDDDHLLTVMRYVERNPVRAKAIPVRKAECWPWSSIGRTPTNVERPALDPGPVARPKDWLDWVNEPQTEVELEALRESISRDRPFGSESWQRRTAKDLGLEASLRPRGRPRKRT